MNFFSLSSVSENSGRMIELGLDRATIFVSNGVTSGTNLSDM